MISARPGVDEVLAGLARADRVLLGRALTLAESRLPADRDLLMRVLERLPAAPADAFCIAITGPPGAGKSTLIEALGLHLVELGMRPAVLAVDPSSPESGGAILGDKTRMERLALAPQAFIRPVAAGTHLGGATEATREAIALCQAAGYGLVIVETVGVGQSETEATDMADMVVLVLPPAGGDELQGVKRGIVEVADLLIINKADGPLAAAARQARLYYTQALHLAAPKPYGTTVPVLEASALTNAGVPEAWTAMDRHLQAIQTSGHLAQRRQAQRTAWLKASLATAWAERLWQHPAVMAALAATPQQGWPPAQAREIVGDMFREV